MIILALEFSSTRHGAAVLDTLTGRRGASALDGGRAVLVTTLAESALDQAGVARDQVDCIAVGLGPGSYGGIRAAIAFAQGVQLAREVRLAGISTAECLAAQVRAAGLGGRVHIVLDAQRREFYHAPCALDASGAPLAAPLRLASFDEVAALVQEGVILAGPDIDRWFPGQRVLLPDAATLADLAAQAAARGGGESDALEPVYQRPPGFVKAPPPRHYE